ncbi:MAG: OmpA family protein, partial [Bacteroidota bacterium]
TDNIGSDQYNLSLSLERAFNVAQKLKSCGVTTSIEIEGLGEQNPISSNNSIEGRAKNRRIEIFLNH